MNRVHIQSLSSMPYVLSLIMIGMCLSFAQMFDNRQLSVGEELWRETLPLQMGSLKYQLQGLKSYTWYEVKISYPASIPASFSIQLKKGNSDSGLNRNRILLNTEKIIFKTDSEFGGLHVLVNVEPEGIVAMPHTQERPFIIFNIVCDELLLGIPHKVWWVVVLALFCLVMAFISSIFLPSYLRRRQKPMACSE